MAVSRGVRRTIRGTGIVLVLALAALLALRIYSSRRLAAAVRDLRQTLGPAVASAYAPRRVPDAENAAVFLRAGIEAMVLLGNDKPLIGELSTAPPESWTATQRADLRRIVTSNAPALELLRRSVGFKRSDFGIADDPTKSEKPGPIPVLFKALWVQRLLYVDAFLALKEHDLARVVSDADVMSAMAAALEQEPLLIADLVGIACEKMMLGVVAGAVALPTLDAGAMSSLEHARVEVDLRAAWKEALARVALDRTRLGASKGFPAGQRVVAFVLPDWYDAPAIEYCVKLVDALDRPYGTDLSQSAAMPAYAHLVSAAGRNQVVLSQRRLVGLALALRRRALDAGAYPETLRAFPEASERDPFTGRRITYTRRPDGSAQLTVPDAVSLWDRLNPEVHNPGPFTWELPAPQPAALRVPKR